MFGFLTSLFASNPEKIVDGVYNGIDKAIFTEEERSDAHKRVLDWKLKWLNATRPQNVARRFIAMIVTGLWALIVATMLVAKALAFDAYAAYAFGVMKDVVLTPFSIILGFYFLAHVTRSLGEKKNE